MTAKELITLLESLPPDTVVAKIHEDFPTDFKGELEMMTVTRGKGYYWQCWWDNCEEEKMTIAVIR
jgi:hypothetical protein